LNSTTKVQKGGTLRFPACSIKKRPHIQVLPTPGKEEPKRTVQRKREKEGGGHESAGPVR